MCFSWRCFSFIFWVIVFFFCAGWHEAQRQLSFSIIKDNFSPVLFPSLFFNLTSLKVIYCIFLTSDINPITLCLIYFIMSLQILLERSQTVGHDKQCNRRWCTSCIVPYVSFYDWVLQSLYLSPPKMRHRVMSARKLRERNLLLDTSLSPQAAHQGFRDEGPK